MDKILLLSLLLPGALCNLPSSFEVTSYNLSLAVPSPPTSTVEGNVTIVLSCIEDTSSIFMHWGSSLTPAQPLSTNFQINYKVDTTDTPITTCLKPEFDATTNKLNITCPDANPEVKTFTNGGVVTIVASFQTKLNADNKGLFYRQFLVDSQPNMLLLTNLRPTFARELFPCLDEPQYSGNLTLTVKYPTSFVAVAATSAVNTSTQSTEDSTTTTRFNDIYLPANAFAFFLAQNMTQTIRTVDRSTTQLSFWSRLGLDSSTFNATVQFLADYYYMVEDITGTSLPLNHLTVVMVPGLEEPFAGYGVIFIREDNYAQDYSSPQMEGLFKTKVAPVIFQFFRQFSEFSTRPFSWPDYWLSQAIAKYLQYLMLHTVLPIFDFKTDLEVVARQTALFLDSQLDTKPLQDLSVYNDSSASVQALVNDPLKSLKGATLLNMLDQSFPAGAVYAVIKSFLVANKEKLVTTDNFIDAIRTIPSTSQDTKLALDKTIKFWFNNTDYPLEAVKVKKRGSPGVVTFDTTGFCLALNPSCKTNLSGEYYLSATVGSKSDNQYYTPRQDFWVTNKEQRSIKIPVLDFDWVVANMKSGGYYRSSYDADNWGRIITALSIGDQRLIGRTQLLDDAFALTMSSANALDFNTTVKLVLASLGTYSTTLYRDWVPVQRGLRGFRDNLVGLDVYSSYQNFAADYFLNLNRFMQNTSIDAFEKARIQALFVDDMCEYDLPGYRAAAVGNLTDLLKGTLPSMVPSSAYDALVCCGARYNSTLKAQTLWNIVNSSTLNYYSRRFASIALGCLSNYTDIALLYNTMTNANIQLKPYIQIALENVADKNPAAFLASMANNSADLAVKMQPQLGGASLASLIVRAGRKINNQAYATILDSFSDANVDAVVTIAASKTKSAISYKVTWLTNNNKSLAEALQTHTPSTNGSANFVAGISLFVFLSSLMFTFTPMSV